MCITHILYKQRVLSAFIKYVLYKMSNNIYQKNSAFSGKLKVPWGGVAGTEEVG